MKYPRTFLTLLLTLLKETQLLCILPSPATHNLVRDALEKVLLHQDHRRCSSIDPTFQRLTCEIWDEADEATLRRTTCSAGECNGSYCVLTRRSFTPCPDGSFNKTCLPHDDGEAFTCACRSAKQPDPCPDTYQWDSEWRDMTSGRQGLFRQLCDRTTDECVATEYLFGVAHLVKYLRLPNESISASSEWIWGHEAERARIDDYFELPCAWVPSASDKDPYIRFDLQETYAVLGVLIRARCDPPHNHQRATLVNIQYSLDSAIWNYTTPRDLYPQYGYTASYTNYIESFTYFFEKATSGRYWKIISLDFETYPAMKADFIGRV